MAMHVQVHCVPTVQPFLVQVLLASIAEDSCVSGQSNVACYLAISDSGQSIGFILGPVVGASATYHGSVVVTLICLGACSLILPFFLGKVLV